MATLNRVPASATLGSPAYAQAVSSLHEGRPFTFALSDEPAERAALLQAVLDSATDKGTRVVRVGNPLRSPLTIDRVFLQAAGPEAEVRQERDGLSLARMLAGPVGDETRLIVVIEQPETLDADALGALQAMAPSFEDVVPRVHFLFCGPLGFGGKLEPPAPAEVAPPPAPLSKRHDPAVTVLAVVAAAIVGAAVLVWERDPELFWRLLPQRQVAAPLAAAPALPATAPVPVVDSAAPAAATPAQTPLTSPAPPPSDADVAAPSPAMLSPPPRLAEDAAALRREFERFLSARPDAVRLGDSRKDELFQEFLERRRLRGGASQ